MVGLEKNRPFFFVQVVFRDACSPLNYCEHANSEVQSPTDDWVFLCRQSKLWRQPTNLETQKKTKWIEIYSITTDRRDLLTLLK